MDTTTSITSSFLYIQLPASLKPDCGEQLGEVGGTQTGHWIPASFSRETIGIATRVASGGHIVQSSFTGRGVEEGIQETKRALSGSYQSVVQKPHDASENGRGARSSRYQTCSTTRDDFDILPLGGNIREPSTSIIESTRVSRAEKGFVTGNSGCLIRRDGEVVGESTGGEIRGSFCDTSGGTYGGHKWAAGREGREEV